MSKIIVTVEYIFEDVMEHEAEQEAKELAEILERDYGPEGKSIVKSIQVIHQEENNT